MDAAMVYQQIDTIIHGCFDKLAKTFKTEEKRNVAVEFGKELDLYNRCRIPIKRFIDEVGKKWGGYCHSPIIADLRLVDNNIIFRLAKDDYMPDEDGNEDKNYWMADWQQVIEPLILPVKIVHEHNFNIKVRDVSGKPVDFKNPDKVEYLNGTNSILIEKDNVEYVIAYAQIIKYSEDVYRLEHDKH